MAMGQRKKDLKTKIIETVEEIEKIKLRLVKDRDDLREKVDEFNSLLESVDSSIDELDSAKRSFDSAVDTLSQFI